MVSTTNLAADTPLFILHCADIPVQHTESQCCPHRRGLHPAVAFLQMALSDVPKCSLLPAPFLSITDINALFLCFSVTVPHLNSVTQTATATITDFSVTPTLVHPITADMHKVKALNSQGHLNCHSHTHHSEQFPLYRAPRGFRGCCSSSYRSISFGCNFSSYKIALKIHTQKSQQPQFSVFFHKISLHSIY